MTRRTNEYLINQSKNKINAEHHDDANLVITKIQNVTNVITRTHIQCKQKM